MNDIGDTDIATTNPSLDRLGLSKLGGQTPSVEVLASPCRASIKEVVERASRDPGSNLAIYLYLRQQQVGCPGAFYSALINHTSLLLPYLYTPTVGEACQKYHRLPLKTYGVMFRADDPLLSTEAGMIGHLDAHCASHGLCDIKVIVVTDGERILGLGDLGANGMGISEGKSLLYTAAAGVPPEHVLPVCVDVGTNLVGLQGDPLYGGMKGRRLTGRAYWGFVDRVLRAVKAWSPRVVVQFEDFANHNAFELLEAYRRSSLGLCCFNDDIQGTASIALSGLLAALRVSGGALSAQRVLFLGAGEAGAGIGELIAEGLHAWCGMEMVEARRRCWFLDSKGLITSARRDLQAHKKAFAHTLERFDEGWKGEAKRIGLLEAIELLRPTVLIGVSTQPGSFTKEAIECMASINERPIIFPLSNPTSKAECTFEEAMRYSKGRVLFASGSPFPEYHGVAPSQANNAYIFPAIGYAASLCGAREISDEAFLIAAKALSEMATDDELARGSLFPKFDTIRDVSRRLIGRIASYMCDAGVGREPADFSTRISQAGGSGGVEGADAARLWEIYASANMFQVPPCVASRL